MLFQLEPCFCKDITVLFQLEPCFFELSPLHQGGSQEGEEVQVRARGHQRGEAVQVDISLTPRVESAWLSTA